MTQPMHSRSALAAAVLAISIVLACAQAKASQNFVLLFKLIWFLTTQGDLNVQLKLNERLYHLFIIKFQKKKEKVSK